jgi:hypothetical protein
MTSPEATMSVTEPRSARGKVHWSFMMSLDGFVAGPNHETGWMTGFTVRPGLIDEYIAGTGAVLPGRAGWDATVARNRPWGGVWQGPIAPILLGDGIRLYHNPASQPVRLHRLDADDPASAVRVRYRPDTTAPSRG